MHLSQNLHRLLAELSCGTIVYLLQNHCTLPVEPLWTSYRPLIDISHTSWASYGTIVDISWTLQNHHGPLVEPSQTSCGPLMDLSCTSHGPLIKRTDRSHRCPLDTNDGSVLNEFLTTIFIELSRIIELLI